LANLNQAVGFAPAAVVASDAAGDIVVAWTSASEGSFGDVRARLFDPAGNPRGGEIDVSSGPVFAPSTIDVAMDAAGGFVVAYGSSGEGGSQVFAHLYGAGGTALGPSFLASPEGVSASRPSVAMDSAGNFVIAFVEGSIQGPQSIDVQRFDSAGNFLGGP